MLRKGRTYELLITRHWLNAVPDRQKPRLESEILFRGIHGRLELDLGGSDKAKAGSVVPTFFSLSGEASVLPAKFLAIVRATTRGANCKGCVHMHYLRRPRPVGQQLNDSVNHDAVSGEPREALAS
jgi:hypothetical protein